MSNKGQTLLELVVVISVVVIVVGALVFATIASIRNASFAQNQLQATKLAQEGLEKVRSLRDRDGPLDYAIDPSTRTTKFSDLWGITFTCPNNCYFFLTVESGKDKLVGGTSISFEHIEPNFKRQFQIEEEGANPAAQKKVTVKVLWTDFAGEHSSKLTTILRNPNL